MNMEKISRVPAGTVVEVKNRAHLEHFIFGNNVAIGTDKFEYFSRKSFLDSVEELMRLEDRQLVSLR